MSVHKWGQKGVRQIVKDQKYYWLKLKRDFFKRHDIQIIENMPNGKDYILFYLKLLCESVDHDGRLRFNEEIPYNEEMLSTITNTNVDVVRGAIKVFAGLHMLELMDDGTYYMNEVQKMLGCETYWAQKKREQKSRQLTSFKHIKMLSHEQFALPNGETRFVDEKRYGGNGMAVWDRAQCKCEICGAEEKLCIHHNNGYSNDIEDLVLVCRTCHSKLENGHITVGKIPTSPSKSIELEKELEKELELDITTTQHARPTSLEVAEYFGQFLDEEKAGIQAWRWYQYNEQRGWDCLPDWKTAAQRWIERI